MNNTPNNNPRNWSAIGVLAMLATLVVFGLVAQG